MTILIVDDEQDIRELVGDILRDEGYAVRLAANSDDCMAVINEEPPSLMILDIWLKDSRMDGIDILKTVKRDNPDVPLPGKRRGPVKKTRAVMRPTAKPSTNKGDK